MEHYFAQQCIRSCIFSVLHDQTTGGQNGELMIVLLSYCLLNYRLLLLVL